VCSRCRTPRRPWHRPRGTVARSPQYHGHSCKRRWCSNFPSCRILRDRILRLVPQRLPPTHSRHLRRTQTTNKFPVRCSILPGGRDPCIWLRPRQIV
jgi:hypothetical protein